jgi:HSP20 family molecular chaperone IbpA
LHYAKGIYGVLHDSPARNPVRINNSDSKVELSLDVPGIKASDLKVNIENQVLTISGNRTVTRENLTSNWRFSRQFALEATVDTSNLTANLVDGVLTVSAPKTAKKTSIDIPVTEKALSDQEAEPIIAAEHGGGDLS